MNSFLVSSLQIFRLLDETYLRPFACIVVLQEDRIAGNQLSQLQCFVAFISYFSIIMDCTRFISLGLVSSLPFHLALSVCLISLGRDLFKSLNKSLSLSWIRTILDLSLDSTSFHFPYPHIYYTLVSITRDSIYFHKYHLPDIFLLQPDV